MAIPQWPAYAVMTGEGYSDKPDYGTLRSDMPGMPSQRSRWTKPIVTRELTIMVDSDDRRVQFDVFTHVDLGGGSGWFRFRDPVDQISKLGRLVNGTVQWTTPGNVWVGRCSIESMG